MSAYSSRAVTLEPDPSPTFPATQTQAGRWIVAALAAGVVALTLLMLGAGLSIDPLGPGTLKFALALTTLGAIRWALRRPGSNATRIVRDTAEYFALFTAISLVGAVASYPIAAFSHGYVDDLLYRSDRALHFDWLVWYRLVAAYPLLQTISRTAYAMIYVSPAVLLGYLAIADRRRDAHDFIAAIWLAATITLIAFRFMPAVGPFAYLWHASIPYMPVSDLWQPNVIPQLRDRAMPMVDLDHLVGLVSAPSFHTAAAVLLIASAARHRAVRVPLIATNIAMLLSTPVEGTHYLTDMILGAIAAFIALAIVARARRGFGRKAPVVNAAPPHHIGAKEWRQA